MDRIWRGWLTVWAAAVIIFGIVLATAGIPGADGLVRMLLTMLGGGEPVEMTPALRFAAALMGCVTIGWGMTTWGILRAIDRLGGSAQPVWRTLTAAILVWYFADSTLSVITGFGLNAVSNTVFLIAYLIPAAKLGAFGGTASEAKASVA